MVHASSARISAAVTQTVRVRDGARGIERPLERARVDRGQAVVGQPSRQPLYLVVALARERHVGGAGEAVFRAELRGAVADEEETRRHDRRFLDWDLSYPV
jgi:hypothetical protein